MMNTNQKANNSEIPSLSEKYQAYFPIGTCVTPELLETHAEFIAKHYGSITAENHMKFELLHPEKERYTFAAADKLIQFAEKEKLLVRGHTLVWHNQTTEWLFQDDHGGVVSAEELLARTKSHIDTVVQRYKGKIYCWDVVNEVISDSGEELLRKSKWLDIIGEDFISKAFQYAHEADPDALLFYNDYNEVNPQKRDKIVTLLKSLQEKGTPLHGMGMQGHWNIHGPSMDDIRAAIEAYAALGLQVQVTELDISSFQHNDQRTDLQQPTEEMKELLTQRYEQVFSLFREYQDVISGVTFWGPADDHTWLDNFPVRGRKNWPFVFDVEKQPKDAFWKIV